MKNHIKKIITLSTLAVFGLCQLNAQSDTASAGQFDDLSLKALLNVRIVSVSKKTEFLFDAPLSASVVTREEILRTGCTSIMEALRLVPGMIVREQSNGNYDIYLRGMDNVPSNAPFEGNSTTTLVMIDSRPIYNYLKGGTFWETLPIDLNDVEKIEVVRGPAAALYGPNAVSGVINIITRQVKNEGVYVVANARQGSYNTYINNASIGYRKGKWSLIGSGNIQLRDRTQESYYEFFRNEWREQPDYSISILNDTVNLDIPHTHLAMKKHGVNAFLSFDQDSDVKFTLSAGKQNSSVQKVSTENGVTPLSTVNSTSTYIDLNASIKKFSTQLSYNKGRQSPTAPGSQYDFNTVDANIEYSFSKGNLILRPGIGYRSAIYDDTKYSDLVNKTGIFNSRGIITTNTASLRGEYKMLDDKLRFVGGLALNKFNFPDTAYLSYQLAVTYKLDKKHLIRGVISRAPRSANIYDTYVDQTIANMQIGYQKYMKLAMEGNKNLKLLTSNLLELGYRGILSQKLSVDVELFDIRSKNYSSIAIHGTYQQLSGNDTTYVTPFIATNLPVTHHQQGITLSTTYQSKKFTARPFITLQHSTVSNYSSYLNTAEASGPFVNNNPAVNNINSEMGTKVELESTPTVFGGMAINYVPCTQWNLNLSGYYYSAQTYYHATNSLFADGVRGIDQIPAKLILNASVSYQPMKKVRLMASARNMLDDQSREFFKSDTAPFMLIAGINFDL
ncbi:MAG: TonB-dependent receptor [Chitinophagaceae bacterium]|nr:TonB-dependent receptor [Chitinophagaceae bacterium]